MPDLSARAGMDFYQIRIIWTNNWPKISPFCEGWHQVLQNLGILMKNHKGLVWQIIMGGASPLWGVNSCSILHLIQNQWEPPLPPWVFNIPKLKLGIIYFFPQISDLHRELEFSLMVPIKNKQFFFFKSCPRNWICSPKYKCLYPIFLDIVPRSVKCTNWPGKREEEAKHSGIP